MSYWEGNYWWQMLQVQIHTQCLIITRNTTKLREVMDTGEDHRGETPVGLKQAECQIRVYMTDGTKYYNALQGQQGIVTTAYSNVDHDEENVYRRRQPCQHGSVKLTVYFFFFFFLFIINSIFPLSNQTLCYESSFLKMKNFKLEECMQTKGRDSRWEN